MQNETLVEIDDNLYVVVLNIDENIDLFFVNYDSGKTWSLDE